MRNTSFVCIVFFNLIIFKAFAEVKTDTTSSNKYFKSGLLNYELNNYIEAITDFEQALLKNPKNAEAYIYKGHCENKLKKYENAYSDYAKAIELDKTNYTAYWGKASVLCNLHKYQEAVKEYNYAIELNPQIPEIYFWRGACYMELDEDYKAIADLTYCIKLDPGFFVAYHYRGRALYHIYKYPDVINDINAYIKSGDKEYINLSYFYKGASFYLLSEKDKKYSTKIDSAIYYLGKYIKTDQSYSKAYRYLALAYAFKGDSIKTDEYFKKAIELKPNNSKEYFQWANAELVLGNYTTALILYNKTFNLIKQNKREPSATFFYNRGLIEESLNDTLAALSDFNNAIQEDSNHYIVYKERIFFLMNDTNYANQVYSDLETLRKKIFQNDTLNIAATYSISGFIKLRSLDTVGAMNDIKKAIELLPDEPSFYVIRAMFYYALQKNKETVFTDLNKSISLDSTMWEAYLIKGGIYASYDEFNKGCENIKLALKYGGRKNVNKDIENYVCRFKLPKDGAAYISLTVFPRMRSQSKEIDGNIIEK